MSLETEVVSSETLGGTFNQTYSFLEKTYGKGVSKLRVDNILKIDSLYNRYPQLKKKITKINGLKGLMAEPFSLDDHLLREGESIDNFNCFFENIYGFLEKIESDYKDVIDNSKNPVSIMDNPFNFAHSNAKERSDIIFSVLDYVKKVNKDGHNFKINLSTLVSDFNSLVALNDRKEQIYNTIIELGVSKEYNIFYLGDYNKLLTYKDKAEKISTFISHAKSLDYKIESCFDTLDDVYGIVDSNCIPLLTTLRGCDIGISEDRSDSDSRDMNKNFFYVLKKMTQKQGFESLLSYMQKLPFLKTDMTFSRVNGEGWLESFNVEATLDFCKFAEQYGAKNLSFKSLFFYNGFVEVFSEHKNNIIKMLDCYDFDKNLSGYLQSAECLNYTFGIYDDDKFNYEKSLGFIIRDICKKTNRKFKSKFGSGMTMFLNFIDEFSPFTKNYEVEEFIDFLNKNAEKEGVITYNDVDSFKKH